MNYDLLFAIMFYGLLFYYFSKNRKKFEVHGKIVALYKTKIGLKAMDRIAKFSPGFIRLLGYVGVVVGFVGMAIIAVFLVYGTYTLLFVDGASPAVAPVFPGVNIPGLPSLSFWHWIFGIFLVALVHEFAHGILARAHNVKVKSSGFLIFGPILGAFVEPDEKVVKKKSKKAQLSIFAAGPFSNFIFTVLFWLLMMFAVTPMYGNFYEGDGIVVNNIMEGFPLSEQDVQAPLVIKSLNNMKTNNFSNFIEATKDLKPGQNVRLETDQGNFNIVTAVNPDNKSKGFVGMGGFDIVRKVKEDKVQEYGMFIPKLVDWVAMLVYWLVVINLGIGLFNLLPLGPIDGGRMFYAAMLGIFKNEKKAKKVWLTVSYFLLILLFINLAPWIYKLLAWIFKGFLFLFRLGL